jgi:hypothetical protein
MHQPLLRLEVHCPNCQTKLTTGDRVVLDARVVGTGEEGEVRLSALFGDSRAETDLVIADGDAVTFECPHCERSLTVDTPCRFCGGPLASVTLSTGEPMELCGRKGCRGHALGGYGDPDEMTDLLNRMFRIPHD